MSVGERRCYRSQGAVIPMCWGSVMHQANNLRGCTCPRDDPKTVADKVRELERHVKALEKLMPTKGDDNADE